MKLDTLEDLRAAYAESHKAQKKFLGFTTKLYAAHIARLVAETEAKTLLDYGCGKGIQYLGARRIHERWGGILPRCYDPGVPGLQEKPQGQFDGVFSCDVMEHIPEHLVPEVLREIFAYAEKFVLLGIATVPSKNRLPDGSDAHVTIRPAAWWMDRIRAMSPDVRWEAWFTDESKVARQV